MSDEQNHSQKGQKCDHCHCCGPTEYEFPDEILTPELIKKKQEMGEEAFAAMMKELM